jgi:hypothetical protein
LLVARLGDRGAIFATPVEADAVLRVLRQGPDDDRGRPAADGLVSFDARPRRLPFAIERKFPSFSRMVAQLERVRGAVRVEGERLRLELVLASSSAAGAQRTARFVEALRDGAPDRGLASTLRTLSIDTVGTGSRVSIDVPPAALVEVLGELDRVR